MILLKFIAAVVLGYLLGSVPFGLIMARRHGKVDIRQYGSGKTGATNVLRTAGKKAAAIAAALDVSKGVMAAVFAGLIVGESYLIVGKVGLGSLVAEALAAIAAVVGHNWSVFLKFRVAAAWLPFSAGWSPCAPRQRSSAARSSSSVPA